MIKVWFQLLSLWQWVNSRTDWVFYTWYENQFTWRERKRRKKIGMTNSPGEGERKRRKKLGNDNQSRWRERKRKKKLDMTTSPGEERENVRKTLVFQPVKGRERKRKKKLGMTTSPGEKRENKGKNLVLQPVYVEENHEFKVVLLCFKNDLVLHPGCGSRVWVDIHIHIYPYVIYYPKLKWWLGRK